MPTYCGDAHLIQSVIENTVITQSRLTVQSLDLTGNRIRHVADPKESQDAATKFYVDELTEPIWDEIERKWAPLTVNLFGIEWADVCQMKVGSYSVSTQPLTPGAPTAAWWISKTLSSQQGQVNQQTASQSPSNVQSGLEIRWGPNLPIQIRKTTSQWDGTYLVDFNVRNFAVVKPPELPSDVCTKEYADEQIRRYLDVHHAGYSVQLTGLDFTDVVHLECGSYSVSIIGKQPGSPTSNFSFSKSIQHSDAQVELGTSSPANLTGEHLLLRWPPNEPLQIAKTGFGYDGLYIVNFTLKNFSINPPPTMPDSIATRDYVDQRIQENCDMNHGPYQCTLTEDQFTLVSLNLRVGSYVVNVSPVHAGGPTACFNVSKNMISEPAQIYRTSHMHGHETYENLELVWDAYSLVKLRKTGPAHDGVYLVDFNVRYPSSASNTQPIPTDVASIEYVDTRVQETMRQNFGGFSVELSGTDFVSTVHFRVGSYVITVHALNDQEGAPTAIFLVCKSAVNRSAQITELNADSSTVGCSLKLCWPPNKHIQLRKTSDDHNGVYVMNFNVLNYSDVPTAPVQPSDIATVAFVNERIQSEMSRRFGGYPVYLTDSQWAQVTTMRAGTYIVSIFCAIDGGPTGTFSLTKSSVYLDAQVFQITTSGGLDVLLAQEDPACKIQVRWLANRAIEVCKTSPAHNGQYIVSFNYQNSSVVPQEVVMPTDLVTRAYLTELLNERIQEEWSGQMVQLVGTTPTPVRPLRVGSYFVSIISYVGGPTGTFSISKSNSADDPAVYEFTHSKSSTGEGLCIHWVSNESFMVSKTGPNCDGQYLVSFHLRNFGSVEPPLIPPDVPTKEYVDNAIAMALDRATGKTPIYLESNQWSALPNLSLGSHTLHVRGSSPDMPTATFVIAKSSSEVEGHIVKNGESASSDGQRLELVWPANEPPRVRKNGTTADKSGQYFVMLDTTCQTAGPIQVPTETPNDLQRMIDRSVQEVLQGHSATYRVHLTQMDPSLVVHLSGGAYHVAIRAENLLDAPVANFSMTKPLGASGRGQINCLSSFSPREEPSNRLVLVWEENTALYLSKTHTSRDGVYVVTISGSTGQIIGPEMLLENAVNADYVQNAIRDALDRRTPHALVELTGTTFASAFYLPNGNHQIAIEPVGHSGPTAIFTITKSSNSSDGIVTSLSSRYLDSQTDLNLLWEAGGLVKVQKSDALYDGVYKVAQLSNLGTECDPPLLPPESQCPEPHEPTLEPCPVRETVLLTGRIGQSLGLVSTGSHVFTVSGPTSHCPTATFSISSISYDIPPRISTMTEGHSPDGGKLELVWDETLPLGQRILLAKTTLEADGIYKIKGLELSGAWEPPTLPPIISQPNNIQSVLLHGTEDVKIRENALGNYTVHVSSLSIEGAPMATFQVNKRMNRPLGLQALIFDSDSAINEFNLVEDDQGSLFLHKTTLSYDGMYQVKIV